MKPTEAVVFMAILTVWRGRINPSRHASQRATFQHVMARFLGSNKVKLRRVSVELLGWKMLAQEAAPDCINTKMNTAFVAQI